MSIVSCLTIGAALAAAQGGETIGLKPGSDCMGIMISKQYASPVTIDARGSTVRNIVVKGAANVTWRGGTVIARGGVINGPEGYGLRIYAQARAIKVSGVRFGLARKAIVVDKSSDITITDNLFEGVGEDAMIISATHDLTITRNVIRDTIGKPKQCLVAEGAIQGLPLRDCTARNGRWIDGFHPDAVQLRNGVTDALIAENVVTGNTQGLGQMDGKGDAPLQRVRILRNQVATRNYHPITLKDCIDCAIIGNVVKRGPGSKIKTIILFRPGTVACGNKVQDLPHGTKPCPAN